MHPTFVLLRCYVIILRCYESAINFKGFLASLMSAVIPHSFIVFNIIFLRTHSLTSLLCVKPAETLPRGREGGGLAGRLAFGVLLCRSFKSDLVWRKNGL